MDGLKLNKFDRLKLNILKSNIMKLSKSKIDKVKDCYDKINIKRAKELKSKIDSVLDTLENALDIKLVNKIMSFIWMIF